MIRLLGHVRKRIIESSTSVRNVEPMILGVPRGFGKRILRSCQYQSTQVSSRLQLLSVDFNGPLGLPLRPLFSFAGKAEVIEYFRNNKHVQSRWFSSANRLVSQDDGVVQVTKELSIEEQYSRKTPLEHILLRPGMYVGPVEKSQPFMCWTPNPLPPPVPKALLQTYLLDQLSCDRVPNSTSMIPSESLKVLPETKMVQKQIETYPALIKVFDEILVNAFDNRLRHDPKQRTTQIDVIIHRGNSSAGEKQESRAFISITNNGKGIPIQIHKRENMYLPELLFGHLLTGSNFDDSNEKRLTGGRHGYGAKLTNIFSKEFQVETMDTKRKKYYSQIWRDNMHTVREPQVIDVQDTNVTSDFTRVSFVPDLEKLAKDSTGSRRIPEDDYAIMCRRVFDLAGCAGGSITVTLNGKALPVQSFEDYARLYRKQNADDNKPMLFQKLNSRWEIGIGLSKSGSFECISFVNGMDTVRGGTHVNAIVQQVTKKISEQITKDYPELAETATQALVRRHLCLFVNALIENPTFDSQMKEYLTSSPSDFGSTCTMSNKFMNQLVLKEDKGGIGIVEQVVRSAQSRQQATLLRNVGGLKKTKRQLLNIPKLDDAHFAGTDKSSNCTLILTEGDSAKALAVAGLEIIGREMHGVFPLRGKFLNVRDATITQLSNNAEVKAICTILGLDFEKTYECQSDRDALRYGHVMLMTDQDADGSHIKGLVINFFRHFWPSLLKPAIDSADEKPFLSSFITPLIKATKKRGKQKEAKTFFSMVEYHAWRNELSSQDIKEWNIKYYKGLGTSTQAEAKEYFRDFLAHHRPFKWESDEDGILLDLVFEKDKAGERREWLTQYDEKLALEGHSYEGALSYKDFINKEMIHFSNADNIRSIPSVIDGLKPSQRKVLYACFKRNLKHEIKVAQLTGYCAEHTAYHHGEASLHATIVGMAQDFVGSNNINLLEPGGQFGTRIVGGKDAASPRYIFTRLSPIARLLFPEVDDALLNYLEDDGVMIEPKFYCPIIPLLLVNGAQGIGTGWSTFIPSHNARDVLEHIRAKLCGGKTLPDVKPWVRGFVGEIIVNDRGSGYTSVGVANKKTKSSVVISELPIGKWTNDYKNHLLSMQNKGEIDSFIENHTTNSVSFLVTLKSVQLTRMLKTGLEKAFRLEASMPLTNMNAFDPYNRIQKYSSPEDMIDDYFPVRLALYHDRKDALESSMEYSAALLRNKSIFIENVVDGKIDLVRGGKSKMDTVHQLEQLDFVKITDLENILTKSKASAKLNSKILNTQIQQGDEDPTLRMEESHEIKQYDYLLNMPLSSLTSERINSLRAEAEKTDKELIDIRNTSPEQLWKTDLDKLDEYLRKKMKH